MIHILVHSLLSIQSAETSLSLEVSINKKLRSKQRQIGGINIFLLAITLVIEQTISFPVVSVTNTNRLAHFDLRGFIEAVPHLEFYLGPTLLPSLSIST